MQRMKVSEIPYERADAEKVCGVIDKAVEKINAAKSVDDVLEARELVNDALRDFYTESSLANARFTLNTKDEFYSAEKDYYDEKMPVVQVSYLKYADAILSSKFLDELKTKINPVMEVPVIEISGHVLRKFRPGGDIAFLPEIEHLNVCGVCCRVQHGVIACRFRHLLQHGCAGIIGNLAAAEVVCIRKIVRRGYGVRRRSVAQIIDGGGRSRTAFVWFCCHSILNSRSAVFQLTAGSPDGLPATGGQRHDHENCKHCGENFVSMHYRPSPLTQDCTSSPETPEENRWPSCHSPVPAMSASKLPL